MAIKDQCIKCKHYNESVLSCMLSGNKPLYDSTSCETYNAKQKSGIDLAKTGNAVGCPPISIENNVSESSGNAMPNNSSLSGQKMFSRLFSFKGRIRRLEYCLTYLIYVIYVMPMELIPEKDISVAYSIIWLLLLVPAMWIFYAQGAKRCHDRGNSGWYQLVPFYWIWMFFAKGDEGDNEYGPSPKA